MGTKTGYVNLYLDRSEYANRDMLGEYPTWSSDVYLSMDQAIKERAPDDALGLVFLQCVEVQLGD